MKYAAVHRRERSRALTDLVDEEGSKELLTSLHLLRPRHLPLVVTIADRDLKAVVREPPSSVRDLFTQSVAEEIIHHRFPNRILQIYGLIYCRFRGLILTNTIAGI